MECPIDGTTLETNIVHSVNIEECLQCRGLWYQKDELRQAKDESDTNLNWLDR
jgi:Zn-finger nucleic acid-binding protein